MDKILLIDGHFTIWRACVTWGPPVPHSICLECQFERHPVKVHCQCGASWDTDHNYCYGNQFMFVFNFFRNLRPLIADFEPIKCFFVLEGHPQFRYNLFANYKSNRIIKQASRQEANEKFLHAKSIIIPLLEHLPLTICQAVHYECDDVIGTLCENMKEEELTVISNDSDFIQLLQRDYPNCRIYNPIKKEFMEAPSYPYVPWKCLAGDKSDTIPSLLKPKKALKTINDPKLFAQFMAIEENFSNFQINRQLIEFRPVPEEEILWQNGARNWAYLLQAFEKMKFASITNDKSWDIFVKSFDSIKY